MVNVMHNFYFKPSRQIFIYSLFVISLLIPSLSFAWYSGRHHNSYGHYGYRKYGGHSYYPGKYYRRNHYDYPRRNYLKSYSFTVPANIKVYTDSNLNQHSNTAYSGINSSAWQTLSQGQFSLALNFFAQEAQSHPNSGIPKAGYALATASRGNLEKGIWAMRRAFRIDPDSLHYLQLDEKGHVLINNLIGQYSINTNNDQAFMISALYYLKHDYIAAKKSIGSAQQYGDESSSFINLQRLVNQQLVESK